MDDNNLEMNTDMMEAYVLVLNRVKNKLQDVINDFKREMQKLTEGKSLNLEMAYPNFELAVKNIKLEGQKLVHTLLNHTEHIKKQIAHVAETDEKVAQILASISDSIEF